MRQPITPRPHEHGSVLVFAIVVLAVLFMIASAFLILSNQSYRAAGTALKSETSDTVLQSGLNHAAKVLHNALNSKRIYTPEGVFDGTAANYVHAGDPCLEGINAVSPLCQFGRYSTTDTWFFLKDGALTKNSSVIPAGDPAMNTTFAALSGAAPCFTSDALLFNGNEEARGIRADGYAYSNLAALPDFSAIKGPALPRPTQLRGKYYVWIDDLDAKLYYHPADWGVVPPAGNASDVQKEVLKYLNTLAGMSLTDTPGGDIEHILTNAGTAKTVSEWTASLPVPAPPQRSALELYFTAQQDIPDARTKAFRKDFSTAININTAAPAVIEAALSQIPAEGFTGTPPAPATLSSKGLARTLALRIVEKRPFLCRMDFEDFLAAHIRGELDPTTHRVDLTTAGSLNPIPDPAIDPTPLVRMIYAGISKRLGPGNTSAWPDGTPMNAPELTLSQYLEIPGVKNPSAFADANGWLPNEPRWQIKRFEFFFNDTNTTTLRGSALITPIEFNNIINSVTSVYASDDVQTSNFPGSISVPGGDVVTAGADGILNTSPQGGDELIADAVTGNPQKIIAGPHGPETWTSAFRPSYYSFFDDYAYLDNFWSSVETVLDAAKDDSALMPSPASDFFSATSIRSSAFDLIRLPTGESLKAAAKRIAQHVRFFYELPLGGGVQGPPAIAPYPHDAVFDNLLSWRCLPLRTEDDPLTPAGIATHRQAGFYQMAFDDWTYWMTTGLGPMLALGDKSSPQEDYAAARPTSGIPLSPPIDTDGDGISDGNGDVSWGPQFAFRSRFYGIYVLAQGITAKNDAEYIPPPPPPPPPAPPPPPQIPTPPARITGEKRLEAVYDALLDTILWQRTQLTDKRAMGDPN